MNNSKSRYISDAFTTWHMKKIQGKGTIIEKITSNLIHKANLRYKTQPKLFGNPDFLILKSRILIFCDSSFWHGRREKELSGIAFSRNKKLWVDKLSRNKQRDRKVNLELKKQGWTVLRFWDTDILKNPDKIIEKLKQLHNNEEK